MIILEAVFIYVPAAIGWFVIYRLFRSDRPGSDVKIDKLGLVWGALMHESKFVGPFPWVLENEPEEKRP